MSAGCHSGASPECMTRTFKILLVSLGALGTVAGIDFEQLALSAVQPSRHHRWMTSGKYQGDIVLDRGSTDPTSTLHLSAVTDRTLIWDNAVVPYKFSFDYRSWERQILRDTLDRYENSSCIRFIPRTDEQDYLHFVKGYGCYSQVGKIGGRQEISLGRGCLYHEIIVHEVLHALGFWHEHSRSDRDKYLDIVWHNIMPGMQNQFDVVESKFENLLGLPYDYGSVMHYDSTAFSANGKNTMEARNADYTRVIGTALDMSELDVKKLNKLYECREPVATVPPPTTSAPRRLQPRSTINCMDELLDCPLYAAQCERSNIVNLMHSYCKRTCNKC